MDTYSYIQDPILHLMDRKSFFLPNEHEPNELIFMLDSKLRVHVVYIFVMPVNPHFWGRVYVVIHMSLSRAIFILYFTVIKHL